MKETIKALLPENSLFIYRKIKEKYFPKQIYKNLSYSQNGEDRILHRIFENQKSGFYVDIGAHHPFRFSNTFLFYKMGWKGINVDAMPKSMEIFKRFRPRDINLELAVGTIEKERRNSQVNGGG